MLTRSKPTICTRHFPTLTTADLRAVIVTGLVRYAIGARLLRINPKRVYSHIIVNSRNIGPWSNLNPQRAPPSGIPLALEALPGCARMPKLLPTHHPTKHSVQNQERNQACQL